MDDGPGLAAFFVVFAINGQDTPEIPHCQDAGHDIPEVLPIFRKSVGGILTSPPASTIIMQRLCFFG